MQHRKELSIRWGEKSSHAWSSAGNRISTHIRNLLTHYLFWLQLITEYNIPNLYLLGQAKAYGIRNPYLLGHAKAYRISLSQVRIQVPLSMTGRIINLLSYLKYFPNLTLARTLTIISGRAWKSSPREPGICVGRLPRLSRLQSSHHASAYYVCGTGNGSEVRSPR